MPFVTVGLKYGSTAVSEAEIRCSLGLKASPGGEARDIPVRVKAVVKDQSILLKNAENDQEVLTAPLIDFYPNGDFIAIDNVVYRGYARLFIKNGKINIVNILWLESYLYGVLPSEIYVSWPAEAQKSQAICARGYFIASGMGRHKSDGFDLCATTHCQAYSGYSKEHENTTKAVDDTFGKILTYNGSPVQTFYCSSNGGSTANIKNVWGSDFPYFTAQIDEFDNDKYYKSFNWKVNYTLAEIKERLSANNIDIGDVIGLKVTNTDIGNRVYGMEITGTNGTYTLKNEKCRTFFILKSQVFSLVPVGGNYEKTYVLSKDGITEKPGNSAAITKDGNTSVSDYAMIDGSNNITRNTVTSVTGYDFIGSGTGHGVGLSQWAAYARAVAGHSMEQILGFYFPGTEISSVY